MKDTEIKDIINENGGNFRPEEFLSGREKLDPLIIEALVQFRAWSGHPIQITSASRSTGSHTTQKAIDFIIWKEWKKKQPDIQEMWLSVCTWPWMGTGIYFDWKDGIGFHVDIISPTQRQRPLRWIRSKGIYHYQSLKNAVFYDSKGHMINLGNEILIYEATHE